MLRRNQPQQNMGLLQKHAQTIEQILASLGINVQDARVPMDQGNQGYGWHFQRGSAVIEVYVLLAADERSYLQVLSPIVHLPQNGLLPIYRRMLELNLSLTNASLGVYNDVVYVFNERPLDGLDANEVNYIIMQLSAYADDIDNQLVNEFGARLYNQS